MWSLSLYFPGGSHGPGDRHGDRPGAGQAKEPVRRPPGHRGADQGLQILCFQLFNAPAAAALGGLGHKLGVAAQKGQHLVPVVPRHRRPVPDKISSIHKKTGQSRWSIFQDMRVCAVKYGAGYMDYDLFEMYNKGDSRFAP